MIESIGQIPPTEKPHLFRIQVCSSLIHFGEVVLKVSINENPIS